MPENTPEGALIHYGIISNLSPSGTIISDDFGEKLQAAAQEEIGDEVFLMVRGERGKLKRRPAFFIDENGACIESTAESIEAIYPKAYALTLEVIGAPKLDRIERFNCHLIFPDGLVIEGIFGYDIDEDALTAKNPYAFALVNDWEKLGDYRFLRPLYINFVNDITRIQKVFHKGPEIEI